MGWYKQRAKRTRKLVRGDLEGLIAKDVGPAWLPNTPKKIRGRITDAIAAAEGEKRTPKDKGEAVRISNDLVFYPAIDMLESSGRPFGRVFTHAEHKALYELIPPPLHQVARHFGAGKDGQTGVRLHQELAAHEEAAIRLIAAHNVGLYRRLFGLSRLAFSRALYANREWEDPRGAKNRNYQHLECGVKLMSFKTAVNCALVFELPVWCMFYDPQEPNVHTPDSLTRRGLVNRSGDRPQAVQRGRPRLDEVSRNLRARPLPGQQDVDRGPGLDRRQEVGQADPAEPEPSPD